MKGTAKQRAMDVFKAHGGKLRTAEALSLGIHPRTLYALRDSGAIQELTRGLYCLADSDLLNQPSLVAVALLVPKGIVCLISALSFHEITTQIPHRVYVAIPHSMRPPVIAYPSTEFHRFGGASYSSGVEQHSLHDTELRVYSPEKTVADCFKFRNQIGLDVAVEALRSCIERRRSSPADILKYARVCRVEKVMAPYMEAMF